MSSTEQLQYSKKLGIRCEEHSSVQHNILFSICIQFRELQSYGYHAVAYGFYGGFSEIAYTTNCSLCATPEVIQYIHGVILTGIGYM